jgi:hypothetical protein
MTQTQFNPGDRVVYVGDRYQSYWGLPLTINSTQGPYLSCRFPETDRPGGFGLTTWLLPHDLIPEEVAA